MKKKLPIRTRRWKPEDIPAVVECHKAAYPDYYDMRPDLYELSAKTPVKIVWVD